MKNNLFLIPIMCLTVTSLVSCGKKNVVADFVVYNNIFTAESESNSLAEAFAVKNGKYIYVGTKEGAKKYIKEDVTEIIDGKNQGLVIPGATEGHGHYFDGVGLNSQLPGCYLEYPELLEELKQEVKKGITQFVSFGWDTYSLFEKRTSGYNFAEEIEEIAPGIPVVLIDSAGHGAVCNKTALQMAEIDKETTMRGGTIEHDINGEPSGFISDQLVFYVIEKAINKPLNAEQYERACEYGMNELLKLGYTNALDAFTNMYDPTGLYEALKKMDDEHKLKINVAECYNIRSYDSEIYQTRVNEVVDIVKDYSSSHLHPEFIKLFADGVVEAGTGWMLEPYTDGSYGNIIWNQSELDAITTYANKKGLLIHAHSYGDGANKAAINSFVLSNETNGKQYRNCLAHVRNITDEDVVRAANNKIAVASNLIWHSDYDENIPEDKEVKELIINNMGETNYYKGYPMKSLMEKGIMLSSSTDAPAAATIEGSVLNVLEVATTGLEPGSGSQPFATEELLSVEQGLKALTINGAWQLGLENERGSIKAGKFADFLILDKNILNYHGAELRTIHEAKILSTYFEGEEVYSAN